ncbi:MAG TPA: hypothetical protein VHI13_06390 [Candidatus Kapabacteria bacterium]|nr:hypothetical protein [Candidatus Kapabacteria bacterium]
MNHDIRAARMMPAIALLLAAHLLHAQQWPRGESNVVDDLIESDAERSGLDGDEDDPRLDGLERLRRHPLNLYRADEDRLARLPGISPMLARSILNFVRNRHPAALAEIDSLEDMTADALLALGDYTTLDTAARLTLPEATVRLRAAGTLEKRRGYIDMLHRQVLRRDPVSGDSLRLDTLTPGARYLGSPVAALARVEIEASEWRAGLLFEKDAGEALLVRDTSAFTHEDYELTEATPARSRVRTRLGAFLSAYAEGAAGPVRIVAGDYDLEIGQGLLLWTSTGNFGTAEAVTAPLRIPHGAAGHASAEETRFLRGAVVETRRGVLADNLEAMIFASGRWLDATPDASGTGADSGTAIATLRGDGYRRTWSELRRSGNLNETLIGASVRSRSAEGSSGLTVYSAAYSSPFQRRLFYEFAGDRITGISFNWRYTLRGTVLAGEVAGAGGGVGGVATMLTRGTHLEASLSLRYQSPRLAAIHGDPFGSAAGNEEGLYAAVELRPLRAARIEARLDLFNTVERTPTVPFPRAGHDAAITAEYRPASTVLLSLRLRSARNLNAFTVPDTLDRERKRLLDRDLAGVRCDARIAVLSGMLLLHGRFERTQVQYDDSRPAGDGILTMIDVRCHPVRTVVAGGRVAFFTAGAFDAAPRIADADLPGRIASSPLSGDGYHVAMFVRWQPIEGLLISGSFTSTTYNDRSSISPGSLQEIRGNTADALALQADITFQ